MLRVAERYTFYANDIDHARCPYLIRLRDGRLVLGLNIYHNRRHLGADHNLGQKPHLIIGASPDELVARQPTLLSDRYGLPPYCYEVGDGSLLAAYNSWREYVVDSDAGRELLADRHSAPQVHTSVDRAVAAGRESSLDAVLAARARLAERAAAGETFGVLQPITVLRSTDGGASWQPWSRISSATDRAAGCAFRGNMLPLADGTIGFACNWSAPDMLRHLHLMVSADGGATWRSRSIIAGDQPGEDDRYNETHLYRQPSGRITAVIRTFSFFITLAHSDDEGANWTAPQRTSVWGYPSHVLLHSSGRALLTYGHRREPFSTKGKLLTADLSDIETAEEHIIHRYDSEGPVSRGGGYPSAVELDDGSVVVAYFIQTDGDIGAGVYGARLEVTG